MQEFALFQELHLFFRMYNQTHSTLTWENPI